MVSLLENEENNVWKPSQFQQYYAGKTVFITGGTGFLGKLILEKLLRVCKDIERIYILIRPKRGKSIEQRFEKMLAKVLFERLKSEQPKFAEKIGLIPGDCILPNLGLKESDMQTLINEVNCVFHCAATVRFDEKVRTAAYINVRATRDILVLSKQFKDLQGFVYVSTAFSNCVNNTVREEFYEPPLTGEKLLSLVEILNDDMLAEMAPKLIGNWPNTYSFSKAIAEGVVKSEGKDLPTAVVRPSIVVSTLKEPLAGWIDNVYGPSGVLAGVGLGLIRTMYCKLDCLADAVPADFVINCTIAAAWELGTKKSLTNEIEMVADNQGMGNEEESYGNKNNIYNYVSSPERPVTWRDFMIYAERHGQLIPSILMIWYPFALVTQSYFLYTIYAFFLHTIPAYIIDFLALCLGKKRLLVKGYQKIGKFLQVLSYFSTNQWDFHNNNTQALWKKLNKEDQKHFNFNMGSLNWDSYFHACTRGGRMYLLRDPMSTVRQGQMKYLKLRVIHYALVGLILLGLRKVVTNLWTLVV